MLRQTPQKRVLLASTHRRVFLWVLVFFLALAYLLVWSPLQTEAATSSTINFQARLENNNGAIVPDGYYNVQFNLYNAASGGSSLWSETYYDSNGSTAGNDNRVRVVDGYISVQLGSLNSFPTINWDQDLYLTMNIGGTAQTSTPSWDGEMDPRLKLTATPYAFQSKSATQLQTQQGSDTGTLSFGTLTDNRSITLPDANGTVCLQNSSACGFLTGSSADGSYVQLQGGTPGSVQTGNFNINGTGIASILQAGIGVRTPLIDTATAAPLNIGTTNATAINLNQNTTLASGKTLTVNGSSFDATGKLGIGTTTPNTTLDVNGATSRGYSGSYRYYENVFGYKDMGNPDTGTFAIVLPNGWTNTMMRARIQGYDYGATTGAWQVVVSGYNYTGSSQWLNYSAQISGHAPFSQVRLAYDGTHVVILLGTTTTTWHYPQFNVSEFDASQTSVNNWGSGWSGSFVTDESGYSAVKNTNAQQVATTDQTYLQGGNSFGTQAKLGTTDNNSLALLTNGMTRLTVDTSGNATLTGNLTVSGTGASSFGGTVSGSQAASGNEFTTLDQVNGLITASGAGAGVTSLNSLTGALSIQGGSQIAVSATSPNITLSIQADSIGDDQLAYDTGQNLTVTSTPTFGGLTVNGTAGVTTLAVTDNATVGGTLQVTGAITSSSTVQGTQLISTVATGTAPLVVTSTTVVNNLNADLLDGVDGSTYYKNNDVVMNTNPFGGRQLYINSINNALFRADSRWTITGTLYNSSDDSLASTLSAGQVKTLFDGSYESHVVVPQGEYLILDVNFNGYFPGYPYGYFYLSDYFNRQTASASVDIDNDYSSQGVGWHTVNFSDFVSSANAHIMKAYNSYYQVPEMKFKIVAPSGSEAWPSELELNLDRPGTDEMPVVSKYQANTLFDTLSFSNAVGTTNIQLQPNGSAYFGGNLGVGTTTASYNLDVQGGTGIVGRFSGRVIGADAINNNEFVTLGQMNTALAGSGVTSLNGLGGALTIQGGSQIAVNTATPNITLSIQADSIGDAQLAYDTGQNLTTSSTPTFAGLKAASLDTATAVALNIGTTNATQINLNKNTQIAAGKNLTFAAGAGNFDQSASTGTFKTSSGAVSLNGNTTIASGKTLTVQGATTIQNASTVGLQVLTSGSSPVLTVDTVNSKVALGSVSGGITGQLQIIPTSSSRVGLHIQSKDNTQNAGLVDLQGYAAQSADYIHAYNENGNIFSVLYNGSVNFAGGQIQTYNQSAASTDSAAFSVNSGNVTGAGSNSGATKLESGDAANGNSGTVTVDSGTASGTAGGILIGTANASSVSIARSGVTTNIYGLLQGASGAFTGTVSGADAVAASDFVTKSQLDTAVGGVGGDGGVTTVGALDGGTANANGATISGTTIYLQSASATNPGLVNTTTQTFAGNKTFSGSLTVSSTGAFTGTVSGADAVAASDFVTKSQLDAAATGAAGAGVTSLNSLTGALTIQGGSQIAVNTATPNITISIQADSIGDAQLAYDTGQNLTTSSTPTFAGLTVNGAIQGTQLKSTIATGTAPLTVTSTTKVTNLNADSLDGRDSTYFQNAANLTTGNLPSARLSGSYTGITAVGTLTSLTLSGTLSGTTASFTGTVSGADAVAASDFVTKSQLDAGVASATNSGVTSLNALTGALTIQGGSQIAVNTASPNITLSIQADSIGDSQLAYDTGQNLTVTSTPTFAGASLMGDSPIFTIGNNSETMAGIKFIDEPESIAGTGAILYDSSSEIMYLNNGGHQSVVINNDGNVGIGTYTINHQLEVEGSANATTLYENGNEVCTVANGLCTSAAAGVSSLNSLTGALSIQGGSQIAVSAASPNITLSIQADSIGDAQLAYDTGQNLTVSSTPTFAGLTLTGSLSGTTASFTGTVSGANAVAASDFVTKSQLDAVSAGGAGVTSLNSLTGALSIQGSSQIAVSAASPNVTLSIQADSIGDTQLAYDTGQNLTVASTPSFTKLGIGMLTPDAALSVTSASQNAVVNIYGMAATTDYGVIQVSNAGSLMNTSKRPLVLQPNGGNVGIGITAPNYALQVGGASNSIAQGPSSAGSTANYLRTNSTNQRSTTQLNPGLLVYDDAQNAWGMDLGYNSSSSRYRTRIFAGAAGDIAFSSHVSGTLPTAQSSFTDNLVIRGDTGRVGIGTASPGSQLDVQGGNINTSGSYMQGGRTVLYENYTNDNTFLGINTGNGSTTGINNIAMGDFALQSNTSGSWNAAMGVYALQSNTTGSDNYAGGYKAGMMNTTGSGNMVFGSHALQYNTIGNNNVAIGKNAGNGTSGGSDINGSTLIGNQAGYALRTGGDYNTLIGYQAGHNITTGAHNIIIGDNVDALSVTGSSQLNIGNLLYGDLAGDKLGIGTSTLSAALTVQGGGSFTSTVSGAQATAGGQFTTLDQVNGLITASGGTVTLQGAYNNSSPASILLADAKDFVITAADTATDPNILFNLQCVTSCGNNGRFAVQNAGTDVLAVNPNGTVVVGSATNGVTISASGITLAGTARNAKVISLMPEYQNAVLDTGATGNNSGTMTSGYDMTGRTNYYKWTTTQSSSQSYDIVVQVPIPKDFDSWSGSSPLTISGLTTNTTNGTMSIQVRRSDGNADSHFASFQPLTMSSTNTWTSGSYALDGSNYTAGDYLTLRIRLSATNGVNVQSGNITLNYLSNK